MSLEQPEHLLELVAAGGGEVGLLVRVLAEIEELCGALLHADDLPVSVEQSLALGVGDVDRAGGRRGFIAGDDLPAVESIPLRVFLWAEAGEPGEGRKPVADIKRGGDLAGLQRAGLVGEGAHADAALEERVLLAAERVVLAVERRVGDGAGVGVLEAFNAPVVGGEDDEGLLALAGTLERIDERADLGVELRDHRGHAEAGFMLHRVVVEFHAVVGLLMFGGRVDGRVHGVEGDVHEPGLVAALGDPLQGFGGDELGGVAFFAEDFSVAVPGVLVGIILAVLVRPRIRRAGERAIAGVETVGVRDPFRSRAEVPLAAQVSAIAGGLERRGEGEGAERQRAQVARAERLRAEATGATPAHERGTGGRTDGLHVMAIEFASLAHELVHVRGLAEAAVPADVGPAEVVGHDEQDVRALRGGEGRQREQAGEEGASVHEVRRT